MTIPPYIKSVQNVSIVITSASSGTATISAVTTANTVILYGGATSSTTPLSNSKATVVLTNSTTVTATIGGTTSGTTTVVCQVVEFYSGAVNVSVQYGTIALGSSVTTNTATISSVNTSYAALFPLGWTDNDSSHHATHYYSMASLAMTNGTTITATRGASSTNTLTLGFCVIEFNSAIIQSIQHRSFSVTSTTATSVTDTISTVTAANTMLLFNNAIDSSIDPTSPDPQLSYYGSLTNGTTATFTRVGTTSVTFTLCYDVVEFASGVLNSAVQRGTIVLNNVTSNTATISSVSTANAFVNFLGYNTGETTSDQSLKACDVVFTNATTLTSKVNTATASIDTVSYEVVEFATSSPPPTSAPDALWFGMTF